MKVLMKAKAVAILTAFLMVFAMMPLVAFGEETPEGETPEGEILAEDPVSVDTGNTDEEQIISAKDEDSDVVEYNLWVGGERVTSGNMDDVFGGGKVKFTPATENDPAVLTLNNFEYEGEGYHPDSSSYYGIYSELESLTIRLAGNNSITQKGGNASYPNSYGIFAKDLKIEDDSDSEGIGSLTVKATGTDNNILTAGIYLSHSLTISSGNVTAFGDKAQCYLFGISTESGDVTISGGSLKASVETVISGYPFGGWGIQAAGVLDIGKQVESVEATGFTQAITATVSNKLSGKGWEDVGETDEAASIAKYPGTEGGYNFYQRPYSDYKKVLFEKEDTYDLWVGGTQVTSENMNDVFGDGAVKFTPATDSDPAVLTLNNYEYEGIGYHQNLSSVNEGISSRLESLTIRLAGNNSITQKGGESLSQDSYGIHAFGLKIEDDPNSEGIGSLTVKAIGSDNNVITAGICARSLMFSSGNVTAFGGKAKYYCNGIWSESGDVTVSGGSLKASVEQNTETSNPAYGSWGIRAAGVLDIGKQVESVEATGHTKAIKATVSNKLSGKGWTGVNRTGNETDITVNTEGTTYDHKTVLFEAEKYNLWVGGTQVTSANRNDIPAANGTKSGTASYDPDTKTLTLDQYTYEGAGYWHAGIYSKYSNETLTIVLKGTSRITHKQGSYGDTETPESGGIRFYGSLEIKDEPADNDIGQLDLHAKGVANQNAQAKGVSISYGDLTISGGIVNIVAYDAKYLSNGVSISHGSIHVNGGSLTAEGGEYTDSSGDSYGISLFDGILYIGKDAKEVSISGHTEAIDSMVTNEIPGKGWTDVEGKKGEETISISNTARGLKNKDGNNFRKVRFKIDKDQPTPTPTPTPVNVSGTPVTTMTAGKTSMTLAWEKTEGADGYDIFFSRCNYKGNKVELKNVKTIEGNNTFVWTNSGLKEGTSYKAYVAAYVMTSSGKQYVKSSPLMHAYTGNGTKKHTNAKSVKVNKKKVSIKAGNTFKLKAKVRKIKKGKKLMPKKHVAKVRYLSTDTSIATVSGKGKIKGVKQGTCYVYAYAHNGVFKKVKVTVK